MKHLTYILFFLTLSVNAQNLVVECGADNKLYKEQTKDIDTLFFTCARIYLVQPQSTLYVKVIVGEGQILKGGIANEQPNEPKPQVVLRGCREWFSHVYFDEEKIIVIDDPFPNICD